MQTATGLACHGAVVRTVCYDGGSTVARRETDRSGDDSPDGAVERSVRCPVGGTVGRLGARYDREVQG